MARAGPVRFRGWLGFGAEAGMDADEGAASAAGIRGRGGDLRRRGGFGLEGGEEVWLGGPGRCSGGRLADLAAQAGKGVRGLVAEEHTA